MTTPRLLCSLLIALAGAAQAGVNSENGDFFVTFADLNDVDQGTLLSRTYNSLQGRQGAFGYGWASRFETTLVVLPEGTAAVRRSGSASTTYYWPAGGPKISRSVDKIVAAASERGQLATAQAAQSLRAQLTADEEQRMLKVQELGIRSEIETGEVLTSHDCENAKLERVGEGYKAISCEGAIEEFDGQGRLQRFETGRGRYTLRYTGKRVTSVTDDTGLSMTLEWSPRGLVEKARIGKAQARFTYDERGDLVRAEQEGGLWYRYRYDRNHNLQQIIYADDSTMEIEYWSSQAGMVKSVRERSGRQEAYAYRLDPKDPRYRLTTITKTSETGQSVTSVYQIRLRAKEQERIAEGGGIPSSPWFGEGRLLRVKGGTSSLEYVYDPNTKQLSMLLGSDGSRVFQWDSNGRLERAQMQGGDLVEFNYVDRQRVRNVTLTPPRGRPSRLNFFYGRAGDVVALELQEGGRAVVSGGNAMSLGRIEDGDRPGSARQVKDFLNKAAAIVKVPLPELGITE